MQEAYRDTDRAEFTALQLERFTQEQRQAFFGNLRCKHCHMPAYFRSRSANGRISPCFFCRPHGPDCEITRVELDPWGDDDEGRIHAVQARGGRLIVQIRENDPANSEGTGDGLLSASDERTGTGSGRQRNLQENLRRGPQRILELLTGSASFKLGNGLVRFQDGSELPVRNAFVPFDRTDHETHIGHWQGFWGRLPYPNRWQYGSSYYFNFGGNDTNFRIAVSDDQLAEVLARHHLNSAQDLAGGWFIVFDQARISTSGRFTADVRSADHVGFIRA